MSHSAAADPRANLLLGRLPTSEYRRIEARLKPLRADTGAVLFEVDGAIDTVYFPIDLLVSFDQKVNEPAAWYHPMTPAVALAGREALVGFEVLLHNRIAINRATVRMAGAAVSMPADALHDEFGRAPTLQRLALSAAYAFAAQASNISACERLHSVEQRLIRWLLMSDDRADHHELMLTHETLSSFLGVRRESVSVAAGRLQKTGLIAYRRGCLLILDRPGLDALSCQCYREIKARDDAHAPAHAALDPSS